MANSSEIHAAADALTRGDLVAFPTETVYGLGGDATNDKAVARIYEAKGRPRFNPLICHVASPAQAYSLGQFTDEAKRLADAFWPGPLTIVVPRAARCPVSLLATSGLESLALRVPQHPIAHELLAAFGGPVAAPSANPSGALSPTTAQHVKQALAGKLAMILDGGPSQIGLESTVVAFTGGAPRLLRPGGIPRERIADILGHEPMDEFHPSQPQSPGQLESHYAPRAKLRLAAKRPGDGEAYLGFGLHDHGPHNLSRRGDVVEAAANLFRLLHEIDASGISMIAVAPIPAEGLGEAINDRLRRAAA
jgi:L-threonylcarbamoyladenylate synthase